jgi:hypothetical protein
MIKIGRDSNQVAKKVLEITGVNVTKMVNWFLKMGSATLKYRNDYGGFIHSSQRGISKILRKCRKRNCST